jgi:cytoskeletal protein RodZ
MSLINDALRRAGQQRREAAPKPPTLPPLQPVDYGRRPSPWPLIVMLPLAFVLLGLAGFFFWAFSEYRRAVATQAVTTAASEAKSAPSEVVHVASTNPDVASYPTVSSTPLSAVSMAGPERRVTEDASATNVVAVVSTNVAEETRTNLPAALDGGTNDQVAMPVPPPAKPPLKLQGIYYSRSNPSALISGKAVFVGETVGEARVLRIERESVVLEEGGKTNVLRLP